MLDDFRPAVQHARVPASQREAEGVEPQRRKERGKGDGGGVGNSGAREGGSRSEVNKGCCGYEKAEPDVSCLLEEEVEGAVLPDEETLSTRVSGVQS